MVDLIGTETGFSPRTVKPVRLATHVIRPFITFWPNFYRTGQFLWYYDWSFLCNLVTLGFLLLCLTYKFNIHMLADLRICIDFVSCWIWAESSFISRTACWPAKINLFSMGKDNTPKFSTGNWLLYFKFPFIDKVMYLLSKSTTRLETLNCTSAQERMRKQILVSARYKL